LADVIAAIQSMSLYQRSSSTCEEWAERISGDKAKAHHWKLVFDEHPEFFRSTLENNERYALVWRRALPRRFDRQRMRSLTDEEFKNLSEDGKEYLSRLPISETQVKTLIDTAITLHGKAREQSRDYQWWIEKSVTLFAAVIGALLGSLLGKKA
jgi:hypothetical protein